MLVTQWVAGAGKILILGFLVVINDKEQQQQDAGKNNITTQVIVGRAPTVEYFLAHKDS